MMPNAADLLFYFFALLALGTAMGVLIARNPVHSALFLVVTLFAVAGLYFLLHAEFLAVIQILTYAGAILVLFIFIIMLLNLSPGELTEKEVRPAGKFLLMVVAVVAFVTIAILVYLPQMPWSGLPEGFGSVGQIGTALFSTYVIPFEISGVLLTVALIGAVLLAKKNLNGSVIARPKRPKQSVTT
jgi:NADH-quinone oxidoreductase subunit J